jgi:hypothetical protein
MDERTIWVVENKKIFVEAITRPEGGRLPTQKELYLYKLYRIKKSLDNRHIGGVLRLKDSKPIEILFEEIYKDRI